MWQPGALGEGGEPPARPPRARGPGQVSGSGRTAEAARTSVPHTGVSAAHAAAGRQAQTGRPSYLPLTRRGAGTEPTISFRKPPCASR